MPAANLQPVAEDERRVVRDEAGLVTAYIVNRARATSKRVLPVALDNVPVLILMLDQGSIGSAGAGFSEWMQKLIVFKWEKIHRLIRDIKGPIGKSCGGVFLKSQVYSSYVWNLGQKPFGSGFWGTVLERALDVFAHCNTIDSPRFQKYLPQLATEFSMPSTTRDEQQCILDSVVALESFRTRGAECKLGRWFSWNGAARANLNQFSAQKMVIEDYLDGPGSGLVDPDNEATAFDDLNAAAGARTPHAQLQKLRESGGGLQLAYKMMATTMRNLACIQYIATQTWWSWYTEETTTNKTPHHALSYAVSMATDWITSPHVALAFEHSLLRNASLAYCDLAPIGAAPSAAQAKSTMRLCQLTWDINAERLWSFAARHSTPPDCYGALFHTDHLKQTEAVLLMKTHADNMYWLDVRRHTSAVAMELWKDCHSLRSTTIRLLYSFYERDGWTRTSSSGRKLARGVRF